MTEFQQPPPLGDLKWAGVDLDGTLAEPRWSPGNPTSEIGPPIPRNVNKAIALHDAGWKIVIHTSRGWTDYQAIEAWCEYHGVPIKGIICGKGLFGVMIDDRNVDIDSPDWSDPQGAVTEAYERGWTEGFEHRDTYGRGY